MRESTEISLLRKEMEIKHSQIQNEAALWPLSPLGTDGESSGPGHRAGCQEAFHAHQSTRPLSSDLIWSVPRVDHAHSALHSHIEQTSSAHVFHPNITG